MAAILALTCVIAWSTFALALLVTGMTKPIIRAIDLASARRNPQFTGLGAPWRRRRFGPVRQYDADYGWCKCTDAGRRALTSTHAPAA